MAPVCREPTLADACESGICDTKGLFILCWDPAHPPLPVTVAIMKDTGLPQPLWRTVPHMCLPQGHGGRGAFVVRPDT